MNVIKLKEQLIKDFSKIYIPKKEKCFMDICQYPGSRYEEICSRILVFYFNPNEEHCFRDLWFRALNKCVKQKTVGEYSKPYDISFALEERTGMVKGYENNRVDILIETGDTVYCIENKIGAQLYNNLKAYSEHLRNKYPTRNHIKIVLTAHNLNVTEKRIASDSGFEEISYKTLFEEVKSLLGDYIANGDVRHLTFMVDFMKTLNNKMNFMENTELSEFFFKNKTQVDTLISEYNNWKSQNLQCQIHSIANLCNSVRVETKDESWWIYQGWDLGICFNDGTDKKIGIESSYTCDETGDESPLAHFRIYITTWGNKQQSLKSWGYYENEIMQNDNFKNCFLDKCNSDNERVYLHVANIDGNDDGSEDSILSELSKCYTFLKELANKVAIQ